jgi:parallel beta-helix repeat protein
VVEKFATPAQQGAVGGEQTPSPGWIVQNNEVRLNHGLGIKVGDSGKVLNNFVHNNGQMGINTSGGNNIVIQGNEISFNNWAGFDMSWEAGGAKFWSTQNLQVLNNNSHDNQGAGLWTDTDNINTTYDGNTVTNNASVGISHEISYACIIRNNTISGNGGTGQNWLWGAQVQLQNSQNCQVYNNTVTVNTAGGNGIAVIQQNRGTGAYGTYLGINNTVHNNTIIHLGSMGANGAVADWNQSQMFSAGNNSFDYNTYHVANMGYQYWGWNNGWWTWSQLGSVGIEPHSTIDTNIP